MAKSKLLSALDAQKGRDFKLEHQKKLRKAAEKRKLGKRKRVDEDELEMDQQDADAPAGVNGGELGVSKEKSKSITQNETALFRNDSGDESTQDNEATEGAQDPDINGEPDEDDDEEATNSDNDDVPLSDLESLPEEEREDLIPHQRLTINNTAALRSALTSISLPTSTLPFSEHQSLISADPLDIPDPNDDLVRELAFYKQALSGAQRGRSLLKKEGVPFSRPADYFAEMVKSDEHMGRVKKKLYDEAAGKKAAAEARKQRDLKKFGKQVQIAKLQERDRAKKDSLEKIKSLKRKRKDGEKKATGDEDLFDIALDDTSKGDKGRDKGGKNSDKPNFKRQKRDQKYGFGGKKRFGKSGDAASSGDLSGFSAKKMKGKGAKRLGKSRRTKG